MNKTKLLEAINSSGLSLLLGLIVLILGFFAARLILSFIKRSRGFQKTDPTVRGFLSALVKIVLYSLVILTAAGVLGIPLSSFVALVASAGVAVSLAVQGVLSNFVGGIMLLVLKPIRSGDYVRIGDIEGTVRTIGSFYTEFITADNRHISMPNSSLTNTAIENYTREGTRRLDIMFAVSYSSDPQTVRTVLLKAIEDESAILPSPAPCVLLSSLEDSSQNFILRLWCRQEDYWTLKFSLCEKCKLSLDKAGIEIPFPQMDVHVR